MLAGTAATRRRNGRRTAATATVVAVVVLLTSACQGERPFVAPDDVAAQSDQDTVDALNAFMEVNGGLTQWKDYHDEGESRPAPFTELTGYGVCSDRDALGFPDGDVGDRGEVNLSSTSEVVPRKVLENAERVWAQYGIERRSDDAGKSSWTQVEYDAGKEGPTIYVNYSGADPDAAVNMNLLAASVCRHFDEE